MNSDAMWSPGVRRTAANASAVETRRHVYCLFLPGWTLTWSSHDFWRTMKEPEGTYEGTVGCSDKLTLLMFSMGDDHPQPP